MRLRFAHAALPAFVFAVAFAGSCNGSDALAGPGTPTPYDFALQVSPTTFSAGEDDSVALVDSIRNMDDNIAVPNAVPDVGFADPGVAEVTDGGYILGDSAGTTTMTVSWRDANRDTTLSVSVPITVERRPTRSVAISGPDTVTAGKTIELSGMAMDSADVYLPHRIGSWSSSDTTVATVVGGIVSGVAAGSATMTFTSEGVSTTHAVTVSSAP